MLSCIIDPEKRKKKGREGGERVFQADIWKRAVQAEGIAGANTLHEDHAWCAYRRGQNGADKRQRENKYTVETRKQYS